VIKEALIGGAVGGLIWLDRFQAFQLMISRPIVGATLVGGILGDVAAGVTSGVLFELLWLRRPPVGGFIAPDVTLASVATAAVAAGLRSSISVNLTSVVFLCFLVLMPTWFVGKKLDEMLRVQLGRLSPLVAAIQADGRDAGVYPYFAAALGMGFLFAFLFLTPVVFVATYGLSALVRAIPAPVDRALSFGYFVPPLVGVADLSLGIEGRAGMVLFALGFLTAIGGALVGGF
jgi:mannose/fructose/N-acetylgalactosamine-specific phosphotransferase system component IIC